MKRFTEIFAAGFIAFVLLALASCGESAGLGSTVDTEAPKLSIEYPPAAAAVKGTFVFAGTCSDDKGISRVEVSIKNLDTGVSYGKSLANVNNSLTWELSVNKENDSGFDLPDGKYQFEAIAYDKSGRSSGVSSRQFDIDNTPPVFVITKPGVDRKAFVSNGSLSKYGSLFTIDGTIADDHSIATMDVTVYDKNGNLVSTDPYSEQEISTTGGTSVTIARYIADGQDEVNKRYKEIYDYSEDADSSGNKIYSCTITIADSTKEYKNPGDSGSEGGNSTSVVYLYDDVYEDYMSAKKGAGLSVNDFRSVLNGTASDDSIKGKGLKDFSVNQVRTALANFAKDTTKIEDNSLSFSLNPNADPTYAISGFNLNYNEAGTAIAAGTNKAMGEQPLTIIVNAGLDQVNIDPKSLKVYIKKIIDADKAHITKKALNNSIADLVTKVSELEINLSNAVESSNSDAQKEAEAQLSVIDGWKLLLDNSKDTSSSDKTVTLSTSLPASNYIEANAYYAIVVTGCDKDGVKLSQTKNYGFMGTVSAVPPSANFTSPKELSYFANSKYSEGSETDKLVFTGTATENNAGMTLREITATLTVSDESTGQKVPGSIQITITGDSDNQWTEAGGLSCVYDEQTHTNLWTFIPSLCGEAYQKIMAEAEGLMYMYTVNIKVTGTSALTYEMTRSVHIDTTKPVVRITSVTPVVSGAEYFGAGDENTYINGSVSLKGSIEEPNLTEVKYDIWASTDLEKTLTAEDSILNELKTFTEGKINGSLGRIYTINQEIDTELITKFFISKEKIEKDQPIQAKIVVTAIDTVGNEGNYSSSDSNDGKDLIIYQETNRPKITLGNADSKITAKSGINVNSNLFGTTNNNKLSISVSDDDYIASYEIFICKEDDEFAAEANRIETPKKTSAALNYVLPEEEGGYKVKVVARDFIASEINTDQNNPTGIMTVGPFLIAVDSGAPTLNLSNPQNGTFVSRANGIDGGVKGTVSKREGTTITGFVYKSGDKEKKPLVNLETVVINKEAVNEVYDWSGIINKMPEKEQGESFKLEITATDIYGQYSIVTVNLGIDETAPTITLNADGEIVDGEEKVKTGARIIETNPNYSVKDGVNRYLVSGTWCDEYKEGTGDEARTVQGTGTSELYCAYATELENNQPKWIYLNGTETVTIGETTKEVPLPISGTAKSTAETSFNIYIPLTECGNFAYKIWGKDVAGNVTDPVVYSGISVDLGAPKITKTSGDLPKYVKKGETLTIAGSYEDSYGIKTLAVKALFKPFGETDFAEVTTGQHGYTLADTCTEDGKSGSFSITVNPASLKSEGEWKFDLTVTDLADRTASITNLSTIVDTVAPKGLHAMDKSNKDLYFRVGSNNNDDISSSDSSWVPAKDEDVGGKYSENTYGNANTIKIRGNFKDDGTGLAMIYYKVISSNSALDYDTLKGHANSFLANYSQSNDLGYTGYFAPLAADKIETKRVFFTSDNGKIGERTLDADGNGKDLTDEAGNKVYFLESSESIVNSKGETKYYTEIESNYDSVLSGFTEGINYLILVAVDNAGNAALDSVIADKEYLNASINVDTQVPEASGDDLGIKYTNGKANSTTEIKGKATDAAAGVRDIVISVNNKKINIGDTLENTETYGSLTIDSKTVVNGVSTWTWTAVLKNDKIFAGLAANTASQTFSVTATVTDNAGAGNSQSYGVASIIADNKVPTVELKTPTDRDTDIPGCQINGKISLEGTINDENVLPETAIAGIQYRKSDGESAWAEVPGINLSGNYTFKVKDFDTTTLEDGTYELRAVAVDKSGNTGYSDAQTVIISQDSDRPKVQINNLSNVGTASAPVYILKFGTKAQISGTIKDDDASSTAVVKEFIVSDSPITLAEDGTVSGNTGSFKVWTVSSGDWTFEPSDTVDGEKKIYFYVKDNFDKVFYTGNATLVSEKSTALAQPYFQFKTEDKVSNASYITYKSDGTAPTVSSTKVRVFSDAAGNNVLTDASGTAVADESLSGSVYLGGSKKQYVRFIVQAFDENGIASMQFKISGINKADSTKKEIELSTPSNWNGKDGKSKDSPAEWISDVVDISQFATGSVSCTAVAMDTSDLPGNTTPTFNVDNTPPNINISSPKSTDELTGKISFSGTSIDLESGTEKTAWLIPSTDQAGSSDTALALLVDDSGKSLWNNTYDAGKSESTWQFTLSNELIAYDNSNYAGSNIADGVYTLPFYVMAEDKLGNIAIKKDFTFMHNPDGDRPKTEVIYPNETSYGKNAAGKTENHVTLSGSIRISGSAIIPSGTTTVAAVYLQIDKGSATTSGSTTTINYTTGKDYIESLTKNGQKVYTVYKKTAAETNLGKTFQFADSSSVADWWGIKAEKTAAWSCTINAKEEMKPANNELTYIRFRACAVNEEGKVGTWTPWYNINIDNDAPSQTATMYQFETTQPSSGCVASTILAENNIKARNVYEGDMYLKGDWYLAIKVRDNSSIDTTKTTVTGKNSSPTYYASTVTGDTNEAKEQYLFIKVERSETYTVSVSDGENTVKNVYYLNRDDTAPTIESVYKGSDSTATANHLAEYKAEDVKINAVEDNDYIYALGGRATESGSGFKRLVFYYVRANATDGRSYTKPVVLDPMITTGEADSKEAISGLTDRTFTQESTEYHLYSKEVAGKLCADGYTFTPTAAADITGNSHIRKGGLIEAGGVLRRIDDIDTTNGKVTFDTDTGVRTETSTTVYFPYAQVVDNTVGEGVQNSTGKDFTFKSDSPDDGDGMPEAVKGNSSSGYSWEATVHSSNMPDGPCALVVLAFDAAGNVSGKTYSMNIQNRAPRLAKVFLGTDLNSNNVWAADEFVGYNLYNAYSVGTGVQTRSVIATTEVKEKQSIKTADFGSAFQIKDKLAVISEFVGGNGDISMVYKKDAATTDSVPASGTGAGTLAAADAKVSATTAALITSLIGAGDKIGTVSYHSSNTSTSLKGFTLTSEEVAGLASTETLSAENGNLTGVNASFTFWDSTDEGASQSCVLHISDLTLALVDATPPNVVINPFYWDSAENNSLYNNSKTNGHIELESDWMTTSTYSTNNTAANKNAEYDRDPKVSGKIIFTGTAYDDHTLQNLKFTLSRPVTTNGNTTETAFTGFANVPMATYNPNSTDATYVANEGWSALSGNSGSAVSAGGKYEWTISRTSTTEEINARKYGDTCYLSQKGHKIYWTITIDTEQINGVAAKDVKLTVTATDLSNLTSANATSTNSYPASGMTDAKTNHVPVYQMDVVPYITKLYTRLSHNAGEEFARSATGRYSVNKAETFRLFGFNLDKSETGVGNNKTVKTTVTFTPDGATTGTALDVSIPVETDTEDKEILDKSELGSHIKVAAANATTKGSLKVTVNGVVSLNNDNVDPSFTDNDTKAYNSQANGITNNLLNDDVKIYLWTTGVFDTIMSGHGANVTSPMMKFDPSGNYYISYGQGANLFAINKYYKDSTNTYKNDDRTLDMCYNKYHNTNVAYDTDGNIYGVATNTDRINTSSGSATSFTFFSRALGKLIDGNTDNNSYKAGNYYNGSNKRRLELSHYGGISNTDDDTGTYNINRVQRPKLTVSGNTSSAKVYMAYYDASANNVKFRYGTVTGTEYYTRDYNYYSQEYTYTRNDKMTGGIANDLSGNGTDSGTNASSASGYHLIATSSTTYKGGAYTAVGYASNGDAVVAWYDASNRQLVFSYNTAANIAKTTFNNGSPNAETTAAQTAWQTNAVVIDSDYAGWYVDLAVDGDGGVHIAYYKSSTGDLKYAYIEKYDEAKRNGKLNTSKVKVVTVDSYLSVGTNITINVKGSVPYIYYYNTSANQTTNSIKVAWQEKSTLGNGAVNDKFTGNWECMTIPTANIPNDATVSGGVPTAGTFANKVILGYMTDQYFEKAELQ
ncbi:hypothetical protein DYE50_04670 [Treponema ruminis]|uniref:Uncharacterized protein n=1 Tax=Treponema ruminis TaxID=744515 RepID=A0A7W8G7E6_9SPIR|nr:hypothetical protein [Treponema ruminis]MBB5225262.1 hypothetical protein [Treponema ruminis]QSI01867.1 hypothetical protein DYE50_04670 [Treponema ruminis]